MPRWVLFVSNNPNCEGLAGIRMRPLSKRGPGLGELPIKIKAQTAL